MIIPRSDLQSRHAQRENKPGGDRLNRPVPGAIWLQYAALVLSRSPDRGQRKTEPLSGTTIPGIAAVLPARWSLAHPLGEGGQAEVWLAHDESLGQWVAIKLFRAGLSATARERLTREVLLGRTLQHPGLIRVFELLELADRLAAVMEWAPGGSIEQRLTHGAMPWLEVVALAEQVLETLAYLHDQGIVHRDIKPSNLLIDGEGRIRLADFGLARPLDEDANLTATATAVGTPGFMSPEQIRGDPPTPSSDLYSLGVTLFHLLSGQAPFPGNSVFSLADHHLHVEPPSVSSLAPDCPPWLSSVVARLLEKDPRDRFAGARTALAAFRRGRNVSSPRRRRRLAVALAAGAATAAIAVVAGLTIASARHAGTVARIEAGVGAIRGIGSRGQQVWRVDVVGEVTRVEEADLDGDGAKETIVAANTAYLPSRAATFTSEIVVVRSGGEVVTRFDPGKAPGQWPWQAKFSRELRADFALMDLDGDGRPEVVAICKHVVFYPTLLAYFAVDSGHWQALLYHSGTINLVVPVSGFARRIRFFGINNRLGFLPVLGEVEIADWRRGGAPAGPLVPEPRDFQENSAGRWVSYTLLPSPCDSATGLGIRPDGGSRLVLTGGQRIDLDIFGNPAGTAGSGRDLRALRFDLLARLNALKPPNQPIDPAVVEARGEEIRRAAGLLWDEAPVRAVVETAVARALARDGALDVAISRLAAVDDDARIVDLRFRQAHLCAIAGRLAEALQLLRDMVNTSSIPRASYDGVRLLLDVALEARDEATFDLTRGRIEGFLQADSAAAAEIVVTVDARRALWWDRVEAGHGAARSWAFMPEGDAVGCLARWRLGRTGADDPDLMEASAKRYPEAAWACRVAGAAALLGQRRARDATMELEKIEPALRSQGADDFAMYQLHDLVLALRLKALAACGESTKVRVGAAALRGRLRPGLLPGILLAEAVSEASGRR